MSLGWVAGAIRGQALARRTLGDDGVRDLAAQPSLDDALRFLAATSYGHRVRADFDAAAARRAVALTSVWHLRVLSGWLPPRGVAIVRALAGWFELNNLEGRATALAAGSRWDESPYALGALTTIWQRASAVPSLAELRSTLAHSSWGDPGGDSPADIFFGVRIGWARRMREAAPECRRWGDGALALAVAKRRFAHPDGAPIAPSVRVPELGTRWRSAPDLPTLAARVPPSARWVLAEVKQPDDLWTAERRWWLQLDREAADLLRRPGVGRPAVIGAAMLLITDCWRTQAALTEAARARADTEHPHGRS